MFCARCFVHLYKKMFHAFIQKDVACIHTKRCFTHSCIHYCMWTTWINGLDPVMILMSHSRQIILTGCVAFAQHVGPRRLEEELLPQCWEQVITLSVCLSLSESQIKKRFVILSTDLWYQKMSSLWFCPLPLKAICSTKRTKDVLILTWQVKIRQITVFYRPSF